VSNESSALPLASQKCHVTPIASGPSAAADPSQQIQPLPETAQLSAATIRAWRDAGYRVNEQRVANWLYLLVRGNRESAVYKVMGPLFQAQAVVYQGVRVT
jgi:hypothetical protein